jgi:hypothetical protein
VFEIEVTGFDPAATQDLYSNTIEARIFDALYEWDYIARPYRFAPSIAAAMPDYSPDDRTWTIPLKPGIYFADDPMCMRIELLPGYRTRAGLFVSRLASMSKTKTNIRPGRNSCVASTRISAPRSLVSTRSTAVQNNHAAAPNDTNNKRACLRGGCSRCHSGSSTKTSNSMPTSMAGRISSHVSASATPRVSELPAKTSTVYTMLPIVGATIVARTMRARVEYTSFDS